MKLLSKIISAILIPLFAPSYLFAIILFYFASTTHYNAILEKLEVIGNVFLFTTLLPFIFVFILFKLKKIQTLTLDDKRDRTWPQLFSCLTYLMTTAFLIYHYGWLSPLTVSMAAVTLSLIAITIITNFWKISTHASGSFGMLAVVTALYLKLPAEHFMIPYLILVLLTIGVCLARLHLRVHTIWEITGGMVLGCLVVFPTIYFLPI